MNIENIKTLIRLGFEPAHFFKRSTWVKIERVMEYLVNKGEVVKVNGQVRYASCSKSHTEEDIARWAKMFMQSPFTEHLEGMKKLSKEMGLPLNSNKLLSTYMNFNIK